MHAEIAPISRVSHAHAAYSVFPGPRPHSDSLHAGRARHGTLAPHLLAYLMTDASSQLHSQQLPCRRLRPAKERPRHGSWPITSLFSPHPSLPSHKSCTKRAPPRWTSRPRFPRRKNVVHAMHCSRRRKDVLTPRQGQHVANCSTWQKLPGNPIRPGRV